jgi:hypothetical protein
MPTFDTIYPLPFPSVWLQFDGTDMWSIDGTSSGTLTKLDLIGNILGTFGPALGITGLDPLVLSFDGLHIWITCFSGTDLILANLDGSLFATYPIAAYDLATGTTTFAFDGTDMWVTGPRASVPGGNISVKLSIAGALLSTTFITAAGPSIATLFDGTNIWTANSFDNTVTKIIAVSSTLVATYPAGNFPGALAYDGVNLWVTNEGDNTVTKILAATGAILGNFPTGNSSGNYYTQIVTDLAGSVWIPNGPDNTVSQIDTVTGATTALWSTGTYPIGTVFDGTYIWASNNNDSTLSTNRPLAPPPPSTSLYNPRINTKNLPFHQLPFCVTDNQLRKPCPLFQLL